MSSIAQTVHLLPFRPPFDWPRMLAFFAGRRSLGVEAVIGDRYVRNLEWQGDAGTLSVGLAASGDALEASFDGALSRHADALLPMLERVFDLRAEPARIDPALSADPWLASLVSVRPGLRVPGAVSAFELLVRTVVGQQVSVKAATTIVGRLVQRAGERVDGAVDEALAWRFPTPAALAAANLDRIGMPGKRVATLQNLAGAIHRGELRMDGEGADLGALRRQLLAMPGIGPWTVEYIAMRGWRDPDAWPASDLVLMNLMARQDPTLARATLQRSRAEAWRPWRAYAAMHIWHSAADAAGQARGG